MSPIDSLIAFHKSRLAFYIEELSRMEKKREFTKTYTADDHEKLMDEFETERRYVRDTISYLEAFRSHGLKPAHGEERQS
jgi:hypothetical protein